MTVLSVLHTIGLWPSGGWIPYLVFDVVMLAIIIASAWWIGGRQVIKFDHIYDPDERNFVERLKKYLLWGSAQQAIVITVFLVLTEVFHMKTLWAVPVCAILFGFSHFPNMVILFATTALGFFFLNMFVEFRNFYAQALSHGLLATFLMLYMPRVLLTEFSTWKVYADRNKAVNKDLA